MCCQHTICILYCVALTRYHDVLRLRNLNAYCVFMTYAEQIGQMVARYRKERKQSAAELARRSGISRDVIANLENGRKRDVTVSELFALASGIEVSPMALIADLSRPFDEPNDDFTKYASNNYTLARWFRGEHEALNKTVRDDDSIWLRFYNENSILEALTNLGRNTIRAHLAPDFALRSCWTGSLADLDRETLTQNLTRQYELSLGRDKVIRKQLAELGAEVPPDCEPMPAFSKLENRLSNLLGDPELLELMSDDPYYPFTPEGIVANETDLREIPISDA